MDSDGQDKQGRALVRTVFCDRLAGAGLKRAKGHSEADLAELLDRLAGWLAYMRADNLRTLAEEVLLAARDGRWPSEAVITGLAQGIEPKPMEQRRILSSWFTSVEGPQLLAEGALVETYRFLHRTGRAPLPGDRRQIREEAGQNNRRMTQIREWRARGSAGPQELMWLDDYERELARLTELVGQGQAKRLQEVGAEG